MDYHHLLAFLAAILVGLSKGGLKGIGVVTVALMAFVFEAKNSTGIILPLFCVGDLLAIIYFKKHVKWHYLLRFLPMMVIGVLVGVWVGTDWDDAMFKKWMSVLILGSVLYMFWSEYKDIKIESKNWLVSGLIGFAAGFTTMLGNLAGPFANLYFLATKLPKNEIVGTSAWVFFLINLFKLPFHVYTWETITYDTLSIDFYLIPFVILGFFLGTKILRQFNEKNYRKFLLIVTAIGAFLILLK